MVNDLYNVEVQHLMYLNPGLVTDFTHFEGVEVQHLMYLNSRWPFVASATILLKFNI